MFIEPGAIVIQKPAFSRAWLVNCRRKKQISGVLLFIFILDVFFFFCKFYQTSTFLIGTIIFITSERVAFLEYISMQVPSALSFILRAPPISYVSNIYYLPFDGIVWICSLSLIVLCTVVIAVTIKIHRERDVAETESMTTSDFILFSIAATCQMGSNILTNILSARISIVGIPDRTHQNRAEIMILNIRNVHVAFRFSSA